MNKLLARKETWAILEKALKALSTLLLVLIISSHVQPDVFGTYILYESVFFILTIVSFWGTEACANKFLNEHDEYLVVSTIFTVRSFVSLSLIIIVLITYFLFFKYQATLIIILLLSLVPFMVFEQYSYHKEMYIELYRLKASFTILSILIRLYSINSEWIFEILLITFIFENCASSFMFFRSKVRPSFVNLFDSKIARELLLQSSPALVASLSIILYSRVDQFMIAEMVNIRSLAEYGILVKISDSFIFIPALLGALYLPKAHRLGLSNEFIINYSRLIFIFSIICVFSSALLYIAYLLMNSINDKDLIENFVFYQLTIVLAFSGVFTSQIQIYRGRSLSRLIRMVMGVFINVALNIILIPRYGVLGAIIATLLSLLVSNVFILFFTKDRDLIKVIFSSILTMKDFRLRKLNV